MTAATEGERVSELKPCPFCGHDEIYISTLEDGTRVMCRHDGCDVAAQTYTFSAKADAIAAWNRRSSPPADAEVREVVEAARRIVDKAGSRNSFGRDAKIVARAYLSDSAARSANSWRPIDTAPMTGEVVDLWCRRSWQAPVQFERRVNAYYDKHHKCWRTRGNEHYVELTFRLVESCDNRHLIPTHWRPLPWGPNGEPA